MNTENQNKIVNVMKNSKGRFFGLTVKNGSRINAQFVHETPNSVVIYDRNQFTRRRLMKTSLVSINLGSKKIAA